MIPLMLFIFPGVFVVLVGPGGDPDVQDDVGDVNQVAAAPVTRRGQAMSIREIHDGSRHGQELDPLATAVGPARGRSKVLPIALFLSRVCWALSPWKDVIDLSWRSGVRSMGTRGRGAHSDHWTLSGNGSIDQAKTCSSRSLELLRRSPGSRRWSRCRLIVVRHGCRADDAEARWSEPGGHPSASTTSCPKRGLTAIVLSAMLNSDTRAEVAEWQTRRTQNPVLARGCGFKSHLRYYRLTANRNLPICPEWEQIGNSVAVNWSRTMAAIEERSGRLPHPFPLAWQATKARPWQGVR